MFSHRTAGNDRKCSGNGQSQNNSSWVCAVFIEYGGNIRGRFPDSPGWRSLYILSTVLASPGDF